MNIKIVNCTYVKDLPKGGKVYDYEWTQADKDEIQTGQGFKEVVIEQSYEVEITEDDKWGKKVKFPSDKKPWTGGSGAKADPYKTATICMGYAKDIAIAKIETSGLSEAAIKEMPINAQAMFNWIKENKL